MFIHSKQDDDFIIVQNGHIEFWQDTLLLFGMRTSTVATHTEKFYSPQSSTGIKSKVAATTILRTRTRFRPPKIRLHCRLDLSSRDTRSGRDKIINSLRSPPTGRSLRENHQNINADRSAAEKILHGTL